MSDFVGECGECDHALYECPHCHRCEYCPRCRQCEAEGCGNVSKAATLKVVKFADYAPTVAAVTNRAAMKRSMRRIPYRPLMREKARLIRDRIHEAIISIDEDVPIAELEAARVLLDDMLALYDDAVAEAVAEYAERARR